jgi:Tfp pilus assembly protein PilV
MSTLEEAFSLIEVLIVLVMLSFLLLLISSWQIKINEYTLNQSQEFIALEDLQSIADQIYFNEGSILSLQDWQKKISTELPDGKMALVHHQTLLVSWKNLKGDWYCPGNPVISRACFSLEVGK